MKKSLPQGNLLPQGKTSLQQWGPVIIPGPAKALILSDVHVPYHDKDAVHIALSAGREAKCNLVILNGDFADHFSISRWEKDPRQRNFKNEIDIVKRCLFVIRNHFPRARIIYKLGNHEERYESFMRQKAPELIGINEFELRHVLHLDEYNIELVEQKMPIRLGDLNVIHGHEYRFAISNPVNPARGLFLRGKAYGLCGHFHQPSQHSERNIEGHSIATWSTGCLCDLHPEYAPINNWSHGFAIVSVEASGKFHVQNKVIKNGHIY